MPLSVTSPHVIQVGGTAYDLRHVVAVAAGADAYTVHVFFRASGRQISEIFSRAAFEAAYQASLDAASSGGGGGGSPTGAAGGDLYLSYPNPGVVQITPRSKTFTYDVNGRLATMTDALGTKTFTYDVDGRLSTVVGTGQYSGTKTFGYDGNSRLASVTVS